MERLQTRGADPNAQHPAARLTEPEREVLAAWTERVRPIGIEAVEDLRARPWPLCPDETNILGIFRNGERLAAWLVVGGGESWAVASCTRGDVIGAATGLGEALALIVPVPLA